MRKSILTFRSFLFTCYTITIMFTVDNLWGNNLSIYYKEVYTENNESKHSKYDIISCTTGTWLGTTSSVWNDASNWCNGIIPNSTINVIISPGGNQPIINTSADCLNITIGTGATLTILDANILRVNGNWSNNGNFISNSSTVIFGGNSQDIYGINNFHNLIIGGNGKKSNSTTCTVNGILSIEGTSLAILNSAPIYGPHAILQYNTIDARPTGLELHNPLSADGGIIIDNIGPITLSNSISLGYGVPLTINSGASLIASKKTITLGGDFHNYGTFNINGTEIIIGPGTAIQQIDGFSCDGPISITKIGGTATFTGNVSGAGLKTTGLGTLNLGEGLTHTFTGTWERGNGTINCGSSTLRFGSDMSGSNGVFNSENGTVEWFSSAPISIYAGNYNNLIISGSGIKTASSKIYIKRNLTIEIGALFNQTNGIEKLLSINEVGHLNIHGLLKVGDSFPINFSIFNNEGGTIEYYSTNLQYIDVFPYNNLILSGDTKNFKNSIQINGTLTIRNGAKCNLLSYVSSANTLTLGDYGQVSGEWGGSSSSATFTNNNYFFSTSSGKLTVTNNSSIPGIWLGKTSSDWATASNWSDSSIPTRLTDAIITATGSAPFINGMVSCRNLLILPGSFLEIKGSNTLSVSQDWDNQGTFTPNSGTVIFDGADQVIRKNTNSKNIFTNLTIGGTGVKTVSIEEQITGILSIESTARLSNTVGYLTSATLQYNTSVARTIGYEWPSLSPVLKEIIIKNTGVISLSSSRTLKNTPLTILEGATLDLGMYNITSPGAIHLECGGQTTGSVIKGTGKLNLSGDVTVINCRKGTGAAIIDCPLEISSQTFNVSDGNLNATDPTDLWINTIDLGSLTKIGSGTISLKGASIFNFLTINAGNFTIQPRGSLTLNGTLTNNAGAAGLTLLSNVTGTGSLIVANSTNSLATVKRYMTSGAWHLVTPPVIGQSIQNFLNTNSSIPSPSDGSDFRGMRSYDPVNNQWGEFFTNGTTENLISGKGYCMRVKASTAHEVVFTGTLKAGTIPVGSLTEGKWNCIGNPYTSAIGINVAGTGGVAFLTENAINNANIDPVYGIYIWDAPDAVNGQSGKYTAISNAFASTYVQQGQGFMVKIATGKTSVSFTKAMQIHDVTLTLKSTQDIWPAIQLMATADNTESSTLIAFHDGMTNGLDTTYDAGLLKSGGAMELYTRLVDDYGIPFAIQALPSAAFNKLIIPVGVDYTKGGQVSFSAKGIHLPSSCHPILEDRLRGLFTDLSDKSYTTDLTADTAGTGRFFLHTSYATTGITSPGYKPMFNAWIIDKDRLKIKGLVGKNARATLLDVHGRVIISCQMAQGHDPIIAIPPIKSGIYLLVIQDNGFTESLKLANIF